MREKMRNSGIDIIGEIPWGTHFCQFYQTKRDLIDILIPYFKAGLENNEFCLWVISEQLGEEESKEALKVAISNIDAYLESGQIEIFPYAYWQVEEDALDPQTVLNHLIEKTSKALASGYDGLRYSGNYLSGHEKLLDSVIEKYPMMALCAYPIDKCSAIEILDIVANHQFSLTKKEGKLEQIECFCQKDSKECKRAEEALRESEERFRALVTASSEMVYRVSPDWSEMRYFYGRGFLANTESSNPTWLHEYVLPEDQQRVTAIINEAIRKKSTYQTEHRVRLADGSVGWIFSRAVPILNADDEIVEWFGAASDITERKQEEYRISRYNNVLKGINRIFSSVVKAETEEDLGIACLSVALEITSSQIGFVGEISTGGLLHDIAISKMGWEQCLMHEKVENIHFPEDLVLHGLYGRVINSGKGFFTNYPSSHPDSVGLPQGHPPLTSFLGVPLILDEKTIGTIVVANREGGYSYEQQEDLEAIAPAVVQALQKKRDEQERAKAEGALIRRENEFRALAENSPDMIVRFDRQSRHLYANPAAAEVYGYSQEEIIGKKHSELGRGSEQTKFWERYNQKVFDTGQPETIEFQEISPQGKKYYFNTRIVPEFVNGEVASVLAISRDITETKQAEAKLKDTLDNLDKLIKERTEELQNAYDSLKKSERNLAEAQEMAHIGSWERNFANNELYWSDETYRIFGLKPKELKVNYDTFLNYVHPDDQNYTVYAVKEALKGKPLDFDYRIIRANGEERIAHEKAEVVFDENKNPVRFIGTIQDITEQRKSEERIQNLANIVESSTEAIITKSFDGIIKSWNKGAEQVYGYSAEEVLGKSISILEPPTLTGETEKLNEMIRRGEKIRQYETLRLRKDGKLINVSLTIFPVFDNHGKITAASIIATDITRRKEAEEKLRENEEKYRNIVETANELILISDKGDVITYANKRILDMLGYTMAESIGRPIWGFISEECKPIVKANLEKRRQGVSGSYELKLVRKDGSSLWTFLNAKPLFDKEGNYVGAMSMLTDITERKKTEEALNNMETARKKEIHHRIKNNLQVISSLLDLQAEQFRKREDIKYLEVLEAFRESQDRVISMALIHEELHEGGETDTLNFSPYLKRLVDNLFQTYRLGSASISLNIDLEENLFFDMDIAVPLGIIINELVSNSLKHAFIGRDKGEIQIKFYREESIEPESKNFESTDTSFVLIISDNGVGIPENLDIEDLDSLGMQLVTSLVDQLDGELELKSNNGTEFTIRFTVTEKDKLTQVDLKKQEK